MNKGTKYTFHDAYHWCDDHCIVLTSVFKGVMCFMLYVVNKWKYSSVLSYFYFHFIFRREIDRWALLLFQQVVGIPMGTNCAPLLADLILYSYESEFLQKLVKDKKIHEARAFNFTYRYIDDVLSINNSRFVEFLPLIYPPELEVNETTNTASSASFLDLYLEFDDSGQISTKIYDKRDDFNFKIINFLNMSSNIPASPAYGVYISQLIRYARASSNYSDFMKLHLHLRNRLLDQGY